MNGENEFVVVPMTPQEQQRDNQRTDMLMAIGRTVAAYAHQFCNYEPARATQLGAEMIEGLEAITIKPEMLRQMAKPRNGGGPGGLTPVGEA